MNDPDALLKEHGVWQNLGAQVTACVFNRTGEQAAFALGDGSVAMHDAAGWRQMTAHDGAVLALTPDVTPRGFISGGDDGKFLRLASEGASEIADFGTKWVEHVASFAHPKAALLACAVGKDLHLYDPGCQKRRSLTHPSTVTGFTFDARGKRVVASHYNGASLWFTASESQPRRLEWKGSHIGVAIHPAGEAVVTAMQENALHGWTLPEGKHMRMSGYPAKTESLGFVRSGRWLASSGAEAIVLWPFFGGGPMGKAPLELGIGDGSLIRRVACHPITEQVAAGFDSGMVIIADIASQHDHAVAAPGRGSVSAIAWNASGTRLAFGSADGFAAILDVAAAKAA